MMFSSPTPTKKSSTTVISPKVIKKPELIHNSSKTDVLVIVDSRVSDAEKLCKGVKPRTEVILLNPEQNGIEQITQALGKYRNLSEIHIISHGSPGCLQLGNTQLNLDTFRCYADQLQSWSANHLILYGCNVAAGDAGREFIEKLRQLTGAKIAASANKTGDSSCGGDWNLEVKTDEFNVSLALTSQAVERYRFAFALPIENLGVERITPPDDTGAVSYTASDLRTDVPEGAEIEYNFQVGDGNLLEVVSFTTDGQEFQAGNILNDFELRRVPNDNITSDRQLLWFEVESATDEELNLTSSFPSVIEGLEDPDDSLMEVALFNDVINIGTDNIFANQTTLDDENINNIERVDYISTDGLQAPQENLNEVGFLILERGGNDAFKIAPILDVDEEGIPTDFGDLIEIGADEWGVDESLSLRTGVLRSDNYPAEPLELSRIVQPQNVGGVYISFEELGIEAGEEFNGYALFAPDVEEGTDLVNFQDFPTDTPELLNEGQGGGLDLIAGGVVYGRLFININDVTAREGEPAQFTVNIPAPVDTPITIDYTTSDADLDPLEPEEPTATGGEDYTSVTEGTFTIPAGETEVTVDIETLTDNVQEQAEQFRVLLSNPSRGFIIDREGVGTILDATEPATTVGGRVFVDSNADDSFGSDEPGLEGIQVQLVDANGNVFATANTAPDGSYQFENVVAGEYTVEVNGDDSNLPEGATLGTENSVSVAVDPNQPVTGINFGFDTAVENVPPNTVPDEGVTTAGEPVTVNVLANDTDPNGNIDPATVDLNPDTPEREATREVPGEGTYSVDENGAVTFTPADGFTGTSTINYTVADSEGAVSSPTPVEVTVNPPANVPPNTVPDGGVTTAGEPVTVNVLANDTDPNGNIDPATVDLNPDTPEREATREVPGEGTYSVDENGAVTFTPADGFTGTSTINYTVADSEGAVSSPTPVEVTVNPPANVPPNTVPDEGVTTAGEPVTVNVLANDTDPNGNIDPATVDLNPDTPEREATREVPGEGTYSVDENGAVTFTPADGFTGTSTINYTVADSEGAVSSPTPVEVTVNPPANVPPTATDENVNTPFETAATFDLADNVSDPDGNIDLSSIDLQPTTPETDRQLVVPGGTFSVGDQAQVTFEPDEGFSGTVTIPYTVEDALGATSEPANISVAVSPDANQPPTAEDVTSSSIFNVSDPIPLPLSAANFGDPDGTVETISFTLPDSSEGLLLLDGVSVTDPAQVQQLTPDRLNTLSFRPSVGFTGNASFTYRVTDNDDATSNPAQVTVPVIPLAVPNVPLTPPTQPEPEPTPEPAENLPPQANDETEVIVNDGTPGVVPPLTATDPDGQITFYTITDLPPNGTLFIDGEEATMDRVQRLIPQQARQLTFEPDPDFTGDVAFTYTATDNDGIVSNEALVRLNVEPDDTIPRGEPIDDGGCDCPPLPEFGAVPLPERLNLTPTAFNALGPITGSGIIAGSQGSDNIIIVSGGENNVKAVEAFSGNDTVLGSTADDLVFGDEGKDSLLGSEGNDTLIGSNGSELAAALTPDENDSLFGHEGEDLMQGSLGDDMIFSGKEDDFSYGGKNNDMVWGDLGTDTLYGDEGNDTLIGDTANENEIEAERGLAGMIDFMWGGPGDDLMNGGRSNDTLSGGVGNDTVRGGKEDDLVYGEAGNDLMYGDLGNDQLCGNEGDDVLYGDINDNETFVETPGRDTLCGGIGNDILFGNQDSDRLCGGEDSDTLYGGLGEDTLAGELGDDWLFGDQGNDLISGGSGTDRFILFSDSGTDTIQDFQLGIDLIALGGGLTFDQLTLSQSGTSTIVSLDTQQLAIVNDVLVNDLTADSFTALVG